MQKKIEKLMILGRDRIFIDVAYSGCGNGCRYCYVESSAEEQELASYIDLDLMCDFILRKGESMPKIISFCPRTEPFKSAESAYRVLYVIKRLAEYSDCFQISTKEEISGDVMDALGALSEKKPIFINVSMPVLDTAKLEPFAAKPADRIKNLKTIKKYPNLYGGLYIKPVLSETLSKIKEYERFTSVFVPDYVCVGVQFTRKIRTPCISLYDEETAAELLKEQRKELFLLSSEIKCFVPCMVVYSSICAINRLLFKKCCLNLWMYWPDCCNGCDLKG